MVLRIIKGKGRAQKTKNEEGLPLTEIVEELDDDGNVICTCDTLVWKQYFLTSSQLEKHVLLRTQLH